MLDEHTDYVRGQALKGGEKSDGVSGSVVLSELTARWNAESPEPTLTTVSVDVKPGSLTAVVGPVGCGKVL